MDVNGVETDLKMKLGDSGVAYFVESTDGQVPDFLITSPIHGDGHESPIHSSQVPDTADVRLTFIFQLFIGFGGKCKEVGGKPTQTINGSA